MRRHIAAAALAVSAALTLAACGSDEAAETPAADAPAPPRLDLTFSEDAALGLKPGAIAFERPGLQALAGLAVRAGERMSEGEPFPVLEIMREGAVVAWAEPDAARTGVFRLHTRNAAVRGPGGATIGETRHRDLPRALVGYCRPGVDAYADTAWCAASEGARLRFVFEPDESAPPDGDTPPEEVLAQARLVEMVWLP